MREKRSGTPVTSASTWYPSKRTSGASWRIIWSIWAAMTRSSASQPVNHHAPAMATATMALK